MRLGYFQYTVYSKSFWFLLELIYFSLFNSEFSLEIYRSITVSNICNDRWNSRREDKSMCRRFVYFRRSFKIRCKILLYLLISLRNVWRPILILFSGLSNNIQRKRTTPKCETEIFHQSGSPSWNLQEGRDPLPRTRWNAGWWYRQWYRWRNNGWRNCRWRWWRYILERKNINQYLWTVFTQLFIQWQPDRKNNVLIKLVMKSYPWNDF